MWTPEYFVRCVKLPPRIEGATVPNDDGTFDIYINSVFNEKKRSEILAHELRHIEGGHFYNDVLPVREIERLADDAARRRIPLFNSLQDLYRFYVRITGGEQNGMQEMPSADS